MKTHQRILNGLTAVLVTVLFVSANLEAQKKHFERVTKLPVGENILQPPPGSAIGDAMDVDTESFTFEAPYEVVWLATKQAAANLAKIGGRPIASIADQGRVQNGSVTGNDTAERRTLTWKDEVVAELINVGPTKTEVGVSRRLIVKASNGEWGARQSNGTIERWVLTQIEDAVKNAAPQGTSAAPPTPLSGLISRGQTAKEVQEILGKPSTIVNLDSSKMIYTYDSVAVVFVDGEVSDIQ